MKKKNKKGEIPKIVGNNLKNVSKESGCCFRSCGGMPGINQNDGPEKNFKKSSTRRMLLKIK
jgi:hypothetical protein